MSQPYIGEIRMFGGNFAPAGWMFCEGQTIPISENDTLFAVIGTTYGGDGQENFMLPDLRGRLPLHQAGNSFKLGQTGGVETVTLTVAQMPTHSHPMFGTLNTPTSPLPAGAVIGKSTSIDMFINAQPGDPLNAQSIQPVGGSQPHSNLQPFLCVSFIISLFGIFPQQN